MPIVAMTDMLQHAKQNGYAIAAFEIDNLDILAGVLSAAEQSQSPVILVIRGEQTTGLSLESLMPSLESQAQQSNTPVAIQYTKAQTQADASRAINSGCNALSLDATTATKTNELKPIRELIDTAHGCGVPTELELSDSLGSESIKQIIEATTADLVNINPAKAQVDHAILKGLDLLCGIRSNKRFTDKDYFRLISNGLCKVNFGKTLTETVNMRIRVNADKGIGNYADLLTGIQDTVQHETEICIQMCQSAGQAGDLLDHCTAWLPIEHVIIFNVSGIDDQQAEAMMAEGKQSLATIPGVRQVITASSVKEDAKFRFSWLIRFCHPAVIDSYRDHPVHVDFADRLFRPVAGDRVSIDYQWNSDQPQQDDTAGFTPSMVAETT